MVEATISIDDAEPEVEADFDLSMFDEAVPPAAQKAVIVRAGGVGWKEVAAACGVSTTTVHNWRRQYHLDTLVVQVLRDTTQDGLLLLMSRFKSAAKVVTDYADGEIEGEHTEKGVSYAKAHLRYQAAKETIGRVMRAWEYSEHLKGATANRDQREPPRDDLTPEQVIAAARAANAHLKKLGGK